MTKRVHKSSDGYYHISGAKYKFLIGSRAMVYHGTAYKTPGGLKKCDLIQNKKTGRIVSKVKSMEAKKTRRLEKAGYRPVKGKFMLMKKGMGSKKNRTYRKRP